MKNIHQLLPSLAPAGTARKRILLATRCSLLAALFLLLSSCASVEKRIYRNQSYFDSLPAEKQEQIRKGKVAIGDPPEVVRIAIGDPDRIYLRQDQSGDTTIWLYLTWNNDYPLWYPTVGFYGPRGYPYYGGTLYYGPSSRPIESLKIIFKDNKVLSLEQNIP